MLFLVVENWNEFGCLFLEEWISKMWWMSIMEYYVLDSSIELDVYLII